jgi:MSHA biogenesis protein MshJ
MSHSKNIALYWERFSHFVHEKTLRERLIILLMIIILFYGISDLLFLGDVLENRDRQIKQLNGLVESNQAAQQEVQALLNQIGASQQSMQRQQELLNEKLIDVDRQLAASATGFIPATLMPKVLEKLLDNSAGLLLIKLENKPVEKITGLDQATKNESALVLDSHDVEQDEAKKNENDSGNENERSEPYTTDLYRHGVEMQLQGSYLGTLAYLKQLESLEWRFEWNALIFDIQDYPIGTVTIEVYTYSTERDWIGV